MILATFNVENLFDRARVMNLSEWKDGKPILDDFGRLNELIAKESYSERDKARMLDIMGRHSGLLSNDESRYITLRKIRGVFKRKPKGKPHEISASGRGEWVGWFELTTEHVKETAVENTARVVRELRADVLCIVEAEDRTVLKLFNDKVLPAVKGQPYDHVMLIDGNDDRGIDVGIMTRGGYPITSIRSHVDDRDDAGEIFSRDCAEYEVETPRGNRLLVLVNHFKSKGHGGKESSDAKRARQARRVRQIYEERKAEGFRYIAIAGDLNEVPDGEPLWELVGNGSDLTDVMAHPRFSGDGRPGTHANGTKGAKLDYILMSPELSARVASAGIERRGVWGGKNGTLFAHFDEIRTEKDAASDHAALWAEADI